LITENDRSPGAWPGLRSYLERDRDQPQDSITWHAEAGDAMSEMAIPAAMTAAKTKASVSLWSMGILLVC
jgi:hypothetical protein